MSPPSSELKNRPRKKPARSRKQAELCLLFTSQRPWRWRQHVPPKRLLTFNGLHIVKCQKIELWKVPCSYLGRGPHMFTESRFPQSPQWISWLCNFMLLPSHLSCYRASSHSTDELDSYSEDTQFEFQLPFAEQAATCLHSIIQLSEVLFCIG
jgi:hypothetical protein